MRKRRAALFVANAALLSAVAWVLAGRAGGGGDAAAAPATGGSGGPGAPAAPGGAETRSPGSADDPARVARLARVLDEALERDVEAIVADAVRSAERVSKGRVRARDCTVSVVVADLGSGAVVADLRGREALRPASNLKLVTTAAALVLLGPDGAFSTGVEAAGPIAGGTLAGDLVLRAGGDPLASVDGDGVATGEVDGWFDALADGLTARGVRAVAGDLVLDEGTFADPGPGPAWPDASQHWQEYCARAGGFSANGGCLAATVEATAPGRPARVSVRPAAHGLERAYDVETAPARTALVVALEARAGRCVVRGRIPADVPAWTDDFAHPDPVALFGAAALDALRRRGIAVGGGVRRERGARGGLALPPVRTPVAAVLDAVNAHSHNGVADQLFLATGLAVAGAGTRAGGAQATARALRELGVPTAGLVQVDGSGLSRDDRVTAEQMVALLFAVHARGDRAYELLRSSLAVAGETGTLSDRMREGPARGRVSAKTGFIAGTSALSGYASGPGGDLAFSILVEYPRYGGLNTSVWKPMQDRICGRLAGGEGER